MANSWRDFDYGKWKQLDEKYDHVAFNKSLETCTQGETIEDWMNALDEAMEVAMQECGGRPPWKPNVFYNSDGDILEIWLSDECSYAKWLTPHVTVMLSSETDEIVGFQVWGLSHVKDIKEIQEHWAKRSVESQGACEKD